jgi:hypothetical protein
MHHPERSRLEEIGKVLLTSMISYKFLTSSGLRCEMTISVYRVLRKEKLLAARPGHGFSTKRLESLVLQSARTFAAGMGLEHIDDLVAACDGNTLVFSKVLLSIYRRANELYTFYAQGRIQRVD